MSLIRPQGLGFPESQMRTQQKYRSSCGSLGAVSCSRRSIHVVQQLLELDGGVERIWLTSRHSIRGLPQPPRFNVVQVLCTPCSTPPPAEVLNMCNTTSEQGVEHPRGPHRVQHVQHVQHLFNTCLFQVLNNRKRDFCRRGRIGCHIQASMVHQCAFGLHYMSPLRKKYVSTSIRT